MARWKMDETIEIAYTPRLRAIDAFAAQIAAKYPDATDEPISAPRAVAPPAPAARVGAEKDEEAAK